MPTPFYHLHLAQEILDHLALPVGVQRTLQQHRDAFFFGHMAPDVQLVSGQTRLATHFFDLPIRDYSQTPWKVFWNADLASPAQIELTDEQRAFRAGYCCHLLVDWRWILDIFIPIFGRRGNWGSFSERLFLHNVLRVYLEQEILSDLELVGPSLRRLELHGWLPYVSDEALQRWRDFLAAQLEPGAEVKTVSVFANRQSKSPAEFQALLNSEARMEAEVFQRISRSQLAAYRREILTASIGLLDLEFDFPLQPQTAEVSAS